MSAYLYEGSVCWYETGILEQFWNEAENKWHQPEDKTSQPPSLTLVNTDTP